MNLLSANEFNLVRQAYRGFLPIPENCDSFLSAVVEDVLQNPGGLVRAQLIFKLLISRGVSQKTSLTLSTAVEYFHSASLVLDDLRCMDNAKQRRGAVCPHVTYGDASAILGALALINRSYTLMWESFRELSMGERDQASKIVNECLGIEGILNGQAVDLRWKDSLTHTTPAQVAKDKTSSLMRLSLVLSGIVSGASSSEIHLLERIALLWGIGYQMIDDYKDIYSNKYVLGKTAGRDQALLRPNSFIFYGEKEAHLRLIRILYLLERSISRIENFSESWTVLRKIHNYLERQAPESNVDLSIKN
jgi:geranylgeranyl diphosphate synthase type II